MKGEGSRRAERRTRETDQPAASRPQYEKICNFLTSTVGQPQLDRLKELFDGVAGAGGLGAPRCPASWRPWRCLGAAMRDECLDISFEKAVAAMQNATNADRTWFWQTCR